MVGCNAADVCESSRGVKTPYGRLSTTTCVDSQGITTKKWLAIDGRKLLEAKYLSGDLAIEETRKYWIYSGQPLHETGCPDRIYFIDLSSKPEKIYAFGVKKACNEFHWASWGAKRSVIAIKNNVRFVYESGKLIPPPPGEKLWNSVEPPHAGAGLAIEDAIGFVEELPLPK